MLLASGSRSKSVQGVQGRQKKRGEMCGLGRRCARGERSAEEADWMARERAQEKGIGAAKQSSPASSFQSNNSRTLK